MIRFIKLLSVVSIFTGINFIPPVAVAQAWDITPHVSAGLALADIDAGGFSNVAIQIKGGLDLNRFIGVEAEGAIGVNSQDLGNGITAELDSQYGIFGVLSLPIGENFKIHSRLGYMSYVRKTTSTFGEDSDRVEFPSIGFGANYFLGADKKNGIRFDVTTFLPSGSENESFFSDDTFLSLAYERRF